MATGPLERPEHEAFCLAYVAQRDSTSAYRSTYPACKKYDAARSAGARLLREPKIAARINELQSAIADVVVAKVGDMDARVVEELARIAFSDIRNVVSFRPDVTEEIEEDEEDGVRTRTRTITSRVTLMNSEKLTPEVAACIKAVSLSANGTLKVELYDKVAALKTIEDRTRPPPLPGGTTINNYGNTAFIDAPPRETFEQWTERRARITAARAPGSNGSGGTDRKMEPASGPAARRYSGDMG